MAHPWLRRMEPRGDGCWGCSNLTYISYRDAWVSQLCATLNYEQKSLNHTDLFLNHILFQLIEVSGSYHRFDLLMSQIVSVEEMSCAWVLIQILRSDLAGKVGCLFFRYSLKGSSCSCLTLLSGPAWVRLS